MEGLQIAAVYENGTLKLPRALRLADGQKVAITIHAAGNGAPRRSGLIHWNDSVEDLEYLAESEDNHPWAVEE
jgi:predicted DNA-binding antitoxin AbrB/MazE fold protein